MFTVKVGDGCFYSKPKVQSFGNWSLKDQRSFNDSSLPVNPLPKPTREKLKREPISVE